MRPKSETLHLDSVSQEARVRLIMLQPGGGHAIHLQGIHTSSDRIRASKSDCLNGDGSKEIRESCGSNPEAVTRFTWLRV